MSCSVGHHHRLRSSHRQVACRTACCCICHLRTFSPARICATRSPLASEVISSVSKPRKKRDTDCASCRSATASSRSASCALVAATLSSCTAANEASDILRCGPRGQKHGVSLRRLFPRVKHRRPLETRCWLRHPRATRRPEAAQHPSRRPTNAHARRHATRRARAAAKQGACATNEHLTSNRNMLARGCKPPLRTRATHASPRPHTPRVLRMLPPPASAAWCALTRKACGIR